MFSFSTFDSQNILLSITNVLQKIKRSLGETDILFFICVLFLIGIYYSTALTTGALIVIVLHAFRHYTIQKWSNFFKDLTMMPFLLVFLSVFLTGGYSDDHSEWLTALRVRLPFLLLPVSIFMLPRVQPNFVRNLHYCFLAISVGVGLPVLIHALNNQAEMLELLSKGQPLPTPIEHVKYSMFNAYAVIAGIFLFDHGRKIYGMFHQLLVGLSVAFIAIVMHVLAVRTGLVILYVSLICYAIIYNRSNSNSYRWGYILLVILLPIVSYQYSPQLKQKVGYMIYDWKQNQTNQGEHYSDSERIMSYKAGLNIWLEHPIIGAGYGDVRSSCHLYYDKVYNRNDLFKLPHSQFLLSLAGSGILGLIIFITGFYVPAMRSIGRDGFPLLLGFLYLNYTLSFLVENSLERSISVGFFLLIALLIIKSNQYKLRRPDK